jgi:hypothetical protein
MTSFQPLRLHVDRGLERHGYPWDPSARVPKVPVKWTQAAKSPADLKVGLETLSTTPTTMEDLRQPQPDSGRPPRLVAQASPLDRYAAPPVGPRITGSSL